ncbi:site-specific integrase [Methylomonas sp. EFPC1]|uniref:tyrosine-type recombinase/integrase n=1 Tax=Methylomonas sp. EFPC1 TaxID=2812647 RepID=UPI001966DB93|nr:site-specific integrase [Methylomonas sp. EFPC1]QSB03156.1 site-specific integrase [Methylomonas sp. EFPC1]
MATIRKRQGRYHTQVRKNGKSITKTFTNKSDALKWAKEQEVKIEQGTFTTKEVKKTEQVVTLAFLLERWEKEVLTSLKSWSVERYKVALVTRELGKFPLDQITSTFLASYRDRRLSLASNQTVKHELGLIRRAMKKGIEWGYISNVPLLTSPSLKGQARTRRLKEKELHLLLSSADEYLQNVIILLIETAMRRGELASLKISNIDLEKRLVLLEDTKNGEDRTIPISKKALLAVQYLIKEAKSPFLLNYKKEWLTEKFITLCKSNGIENFRLHDLRHEGVSSLFEKGLNMIEVSSISGHKDLSMLKRYTHINPLTLVDRI